MKLNSVSADGGRVMLEADGNVVSMSGDIDQAAPKAFLAPFFDAIHLAAEEESLRDVKVDIRRLSFLNSSAVKELIAWVLRRNRLPAGRKYVLEFIYDSSILWQRVTMPTLGQLDPGFVVLTDHARTPSGRRR